MFTHLFSLSALVNPSALTWQWQNCTSYDSSCTNCSQNPECAWCFSEKSCLPGKLRNYRGACDEDEWYYGDCKKPGKKYDVICYVLLILVIILVIAIIMLLLAKSFPRKPKEKNVSENYQPVSIKDEIKPHQGTPLVIRETITFGKPIMTKEGTPRPPRTDELRKKYLLY